MLPELQDSLYKRLVKGFILLRKVKVLRIITTVIKSAIKRHSYLNEIKNTNSFHLQVDSSIFRKITVKPFINDENELSYFRI